MITFKEIAHLYLGCQLHCCTDPAGLTPERLSEILSGKRDSMPILRPLSDMTDDEIIWLFVLRATAHNTTINKKCRRTSIDGKFMQIEFDDLSSDYQDLRTIYPEQFAWLLSRSFDLFGLIESDQAISSSQVTKKEVVE